MRQKEIPEGRGGDRLGCKGGREGGRSLSLPSHSPSHDSTLPSTLPPCLSGRGEGSRHSSSTCQWGLSLPPSLPCFPLSIPSHRAGRHSGENARWICIAPFGGSEFYRGFMQIHYNLFYGITGFMPWQAHNHLGNLNSENPRVSLYWGARYPGTWVPVPGYSIGVISTKFNKISSLSCICTTILLKMLEAVLVEVENFLKRNEN